MAIVSVSGACSRSGKTALAAALLGALPPRAAAAVKFTTADDVFERCPRGTACAVCDIDVPFRLVEDAATLDHPGTDTERLRRSGAGRVVWAIARRGAVPAAWAVVRRRVAGWPLVVMEGSTIVPFARPGLHLFVVHPWLSPSRWKDGSAERIAAADLVVINRPAADARPPHEDVLQALEGAGARPERTRVADVTAPLGSWAPDVRARLASLAGAKDAVPA